MVAGGWFDSGRLLVVLLALLVSLALATRKEGAGRGEGGVQDPHFIKSNC